VGIKVLFVVKDDDSLRLRPLKSFTTNRGCPFPCSYCFNPSLVDHYGASWKKVRIRSPENVVRELAHVRSHGPLQVIGFRAPEGNAGSGQPARVACAGDHP
jgi:hypothetical protein